MPRKIKSVTAFLTVLFFLTTQLGLSPSVFAAAEFPPGVGAYGNTPLRLEIPQNLGTIDTLTAGPGPTLIHIQTAHGNYEAQQSIARILRYLKDHYGIKLLLVEGSAFKLEPEMLRFFPHHDRLNLEVADKLAKRALYKGAEMFLAGERDVEAYGIEDLGAYRRNLVDFKTVLGQQSKIEGLLQKIRAAAVRIKSTSLGLELRTFLEQKDAVDSGLMALPEWISKLKVLANQHLDLQIDGASSQLDWPMLVRYFKLREIEGRLDMAAFDKEQQQFLRVIRNSVPGTELYDAVSLLLSSGLRQPGLSDPETGRLFESLVQALPKDFPFHRYPQVKNFIYHLILQSELKSKLLMEELNQLEAVVLEKLIQNDGERKAYQRFKHYKLLEKLLTLELTPEDWQMIGTRYKGDRFQKRLLRNLSPLYLVPNFTSKPVPFVPGTEFTKAFRFYRGVQARDRCMTRNIERILNRTGQNKAVVITGGFHAGPFEDYFKSRGFNYALISPRISGEETGGAYRNRSFHSLSAQDHGHYLESILHRAPNFFVRSTFETISPALPARERIQTLGLRDTLWLAGEELRVALDTAPSAEFLREISSSFPARQFGYRSELRSGKAFVEPLPNGLLDRRGIRRSLPLPPFLNLLKMRAPQSSKKHFFRSSPPAEIKFKPRRSELRSLKLTFLGGNTLEFDFQRLPLPQTALEAEALQGLTDLGIQSIEVNGKPIRLDPAKPLDAKTLASILASPEEWLDDSQSQGGNDTRSEVRSTSWDDMWRRERNRRNWQRDILDQVRREQQDRLDSSGFQIQGVSKEQVFGPSRLELGEGFIGIPGRRELYKIKLDRLGDLQATVTIRFPDGSERLFEGIPWDKWSNPFWRTQRGDHFDPIGLGFKIRLVRKGTTHVDIFSSRSELRVGVPSFQGDLEYVTLSRSEKWGGFESRPRLRHELIKLLQSPHASQVKALAWLGSEPKSEELIHENLAGVVLTDNEEATLNSAVTVFIRDYIPGKIQYRFMVQKAVFGVKEKDTTLREYLDGAEGGFMLVVYPTQSGGDHGVRETVPHPTPVRRRTFEEPVPPAPEDSSYEKIQSQPSKATKVEVPAKKGKNPKHSKLLLNPERGSSEAVPNRPVRSEVRMIAVRVDAAGEMAAALVQQQMARVGMTPEAFVDDWIKLIEGGRFTEDSLRDNWNILHKGAFLHPAIVARLKDFERLAKQGASESVKKVARKIIREHQEKQADAPKVRKSSVQVKGRDKKMAEYPLTPNTLVRFEGGYEDSLFYFAEYSRRFLDKFYLQYRNDWNPYSGFLSLKTILPHEWPFSDWASQIKITSLYLFGEEFSEAKLAAKLMQMDDRATYLLSWAAYAFNFILTFAIRKKGRFKFSDLVRAFQKQMGREGKARKSDELEGLTLKSKAADRSHPDLMLLARALNVISTTTPIIFSERKKSRSELRNENLEEDAAGIPDVIDTPGKAQTLAQIIREKAATAPDRTDLGQLGDEIREIRHQPVKIGREFVSVIAQTFREAMSQLKQIQDLRDEAAAPGIAAQMQAIAGEEGALNDLDLTYARIIALYPRNSQSRTATNTIRKGRSEAWRIIDERIAQKDKADAEKRVREMLQIADKLVVSDPQNAREAYAKIQALWPAEKRTREVRRILEEGKERADGIVESKVLAEYQRHGDVVAKRILLVGGRVKRYVNPFSTRDKVTGILSDFDKTPFAWRDYEAIQKAVAEVNRKIDEEAAQRTLSIIRKIELIRRTIKKNSDFDKVEERLGEIKTEAARNGFILDGRPRPRQEPQSYRIRVAADKTVAKIEKLKGKRSWLNAWEAVTEILNLWPSVSLDKSLTRAINRVGRLSQRLITDLGIYPPHVGLVRQAAQFVIESLKQEHSRSELRLGDKKEQVLASGVLAGPSRSAFRQMLGEISRNLTTNADKLRQAMEPLSGTEVKIGTDEIQLNYEPLMRDGRISIKSILKWENNRLVLERDQFREAGRMTPVRGQPNPHFRFVIEMSQNSTSVSTLGGRGQTDRRLPDPSPLLGVSPFPLRVDILHRGRELEFRLHLEPQVKRYIDHSLSLIGEEDALPAVMLSSPARSELRPQEKKALRLVESLTKILRTLSRQERSRDMMTRTTAMILYSILMLDINQPEYYAFRNNPSKQNRKQLTDFLFSRRQTITENLVEAHQKGEEFLRRYPTNRGIQNVVREVEKLLRLWAPDDKRVQQIFQTQLPASRSELRRHGSGIVGESAVFQRREPFFVFPDFWQAQFNQGNVALNLVNVILQASQAGANVLQPFSEDTKLALQVLKDYGEFALPGIFGAFAGRFWHKVFSSLRNKIAQGRRNVPEKGHSVNYFLVNLFMPYSQSNLRSELRRGEEGELREAAPNQPVRSELRNNVPEKVSDLERIDGLKLILKNPNGLESETLQQINRFIQVLENPESRKEDKQLVRSAADAVIALTNQARSKLRNEIKKFTLQESAFEGIDIPLPADQKLVIHFSVGNQRGEYTLWKKGDTVILKEEARRVTAPIAAILLLLPKRVLQFLDRFFPRETIDLIRYKHGYPALVGVDETRNPPSPLTIKFQILKNKTGIHLTNQTGMIVRGDYQLLPRGAERALRKSAPNQPVRSELRAGTMSLAQTKALITAFQLATEKEDKLEAIQLLGVKNNHAATDFLVGLLTDADSDIVVQAAESLEKIGIDPQEGEYQDKPQALVNGLGQLLAELKDKGASVPGSLDQEYLVPYVRPGGPDVGSVWVYQGKVSPQAEAQINPQRKFEALATAFGHLKISDAIPLLLETYNASGVFRQTGARYALIMALVHMGKEGVPYLTEAVSNHSSAIVRKLSAEVLYGFLHSRLRFLVQNHHVGPNTKIGPDAKIKNSDHLALSLSEFDRTISEAARKIFDPDVKTLARIYIILEKWDELTALGKEALPVIDEVFQNLEAYGVKPAPLIKADQKIRQQVQTEETPDPWQGVENDTPPPSDESGNGASRSELRGTVLDTVMQARIKEDPASRLIEQLLNPWVEKNLSYFPTVRNPKIGRKEILTPVFEFRYTGRKDPDLAHWKDNQGGLWTQAEYDQRFRLADIVSNPEAGAREGRFEILGFGALPDAEVLVNTILDFVSQGFWFGKFNFAARRRFHQRARLAELIEGIRQHASLRQMERDAKTAVPAVRVPEFSVDVSPPEKGEGLIIRVQVIGEFDQSFPISSVQDLARFLRFFGISPLVTGNAHNPQLKIPKQDDSDTSLRKKNETTRRDFLTFDFPGDSEPIQQLIAGRMERFKKFDRLIGDLQGFRPINWGQTSFSDSIRSELRRGEEREPRDAAPNQPVRSELRTGDQKQGALEDLKANITLAEIIIPQPLQEVLTRRGESKQRTELVQDQREAVRKIASLVISAIRKVQTEQISVAQASRKKSYAQKTELQLASEELARMRDLVIPFFGKWLLTNGHARSGELEREVMIALERIIVELTKAADKLFEAENTGRPKRKYANIFAATVIRFASLKLQLIGLDHGFKSDEIQRQHMILRYKLDDLTAKFGFKVDIILPQIVVSTKGQADILEELIPIPVNVVEEALTRSHGNLMGQIAEARGRLLKGSERKHSSNVQPKKRSELRLTSVPGTESFALSLAASKILDQEPILRPQWIAALRAIVAKFGNRPLDWLQRKWGIVLESRFVPDDERDVLQDLGRSTYFKLADRFANSMKAAVTRAEAANDGLGELVLRGFWLDQIFKHPEALFNVLYGFSELKAKGLKAALVLPISQSDFTQRLKNSLLNRKAGLGAMGVSPADIQELLGTVLRNGTVRFVPQNEMEGYVAEAAREKRGIAVLGAQEDEFVAGALNFMLYPETLRKSANRRLAMQTLPFDLLKAAWLAREIRDPLEQNELLGVPLKHKVFKGAVLNFTGKSFKFASLTGYLELALETSRLIQQMA